ncbi:MAG: phosphate/phosphite/phosphonate ABC transporter substrate-binding protein [Candidatus Thiodiazotropha sp. (ex Monitilora ramsayi)]|nr:phosphate/phosphite/phosphonate ABC transporter substrate-binding protein [Candidatus Thiodiazotropha sp. (ex Monitilora ramsayi)]
MKYIIISFITLCLMFAISAHSEILVDRYKDNPDIGFFGRMSKVLFDANATDTTIATDMIIRTVFGQMNMKSEIKVYDNRDHLIKDLTENRLDAVFINTIDFIELEHLVNPDYLYTLVYGQHTEQKIYLLTRKKDGIDNISQLRDKTISIPKGHFLGKYYLDILLMNKELPTQDRFFSKTLETVDTNTAIVDLFIGKSDSALVSDIAFELAGELNTQIIRDLKVINASNQMVPQVITINKNVPAHIMKKVDAFLVKSHENTRIRHLLSLFRAKRFVKLEEDNITETRKLLDEYNKLIILTNKQSHEKTKQIANF